MRNKNDSLTKQWKGCSFISATNAVNSLQCKGNVRAHVVFFSRFEFEKFMYFSLLWQNWNPSFCLIQSYYLIYDFLIYVSHILYHITQAAVFSDVNLTEQQFDVLFVALTITWPRPVLPPPPSFLQLDKIYIKVIFYMI